jgi:hypothetical protein
LQQDAVGDGTDHFLTTAPGHGAVFHIQHADGDKLVDVFLDGTGIALEALRKGCYRCRLFFDGSKKFNAGELITENISAGSSKVRVYSG